MARFTALDYELVVTIYTYVATDSEDAHTKVTSRIGFSSRNPVSVSSRAADQCVPSPI